jgi:cytochrome c peroxidase
MMRRLGKALLVVSMVIFVTLPALSANKIIFSESERATIVSHGPWPPKMTSDPSNRVSGDKSAITFGRELFRSRFLSTSRRHSCVTCHKPNLAYGDGLARSTGVSTVDRNTLSLANLRLNRWYGWDGSSDNLWAQSIRPILDPREMNATPTLIAKRLRNDAPFSRGYQATFKSSPTSHDDEQILVNLGKALAAYQETIVTPKTPFDRFRDTLAKTDKQQVGQYPLAAKRGLKTFLGKGNCGLCHLGPNFTNGEFDDASIRSFKPSGGIDKGRFGGIQKLKKSPHTLSSRFNDDPRKASGVATRYLTRSHRSWGQFRVPSLRNVSKTAPYMHDGSLATLADVVRHYSNLNEERPHLDGRGLLRRLNLTDIEIADIVAFLETL